MRTYLKRVSCVDRMCVLIGCVLLECVVIEWVVIACIDKNTVVVSVVTLVLPLT